MSKSANGNVLLQLDNVASERIRRLSCEIKPGQIVRIICATQEVRAELWSLLVDGRAPVSGRIEISGNDLSTLRDRERLAIFQRIGVVSHDGGLISNLKVWENIVLPVCYHRGTEVAALEDGVVAVFGELGLDAGAVKKLMQRLPDQLNMLERRWVSAVRAMLLEPDIMFIDAPFVGVEREAATRLLRVLLQFHRARPDRATIFLLPDEPFSERVSADVTIEV